MPVLTCVTYHHFAAAADEFVRTLGVTTSPDAFRKHLAHYRRYYTPVGLDEVLSGDLPPRPLLITIDDAYRSVLEVAAPMLREAGIPAVFFTNPLTINGARLPMDNLLSLAASRLSPSRFAQCLRQATGIGSHESGGVALAGSLLVHLNAATRNELRTGLLAALNLEEADVLRRSGAFLSPADLARMPAEFNIEVANHTRSHVHCRTLAPDELEEELGQAKAEIEAITGRSVRAFSFPYGSLTDATPSVVDYLRKSGHRALFFVHALANIARPEPDFWYRTSVQDHGARILPARLQILPRLRSLKAALK